eukprot:1157626-Pelagomonas_calceolata.AAC.25
MRALHSNRGISVAGHALMPLTKGFPVYSCRACSPPAVLQVEWRQSISAVAGGPDSVVTGFCFSLELEAICISLSTGELLLLNVDTQQLEEVGAVEGGIVALQWSPDGEVFAAVSGMGNILLMDQVRLLATPAFVPLPLPLCKCFSCYHCCRFHFLQASVHVMLLGKSVCRVAVALKPASASSNGDLKSTGTDPQASPPARGPLCACANICTHPGPRKAALHVLHPELIVHPTFVSLCLTHLT